MQFLHPRRQACGVARVVDQLRRQGATCRARRLGRECGGYHLFAGAVAAGQARALLCLVAVDHEHAVVFGRGAGLSQQRDDDDQVRRMDCRRQPCGAGANRRVQHGFQFAPGRGIAKHQRAQCATVERAVRRLNAGAETGEHLRQQRSARRHHLAGELVEINDGYAEPGE